jgi:hypothetical protein
MTMHHPLTRAGVGLVFAAALATVPTSAEASSSIAVAERSTASASESETHRERGLVLECRGKGQGMRAYVSVYENHKFGNTLQVVLGGPDDGRGNSRSTKRDLVDRGQLTRAAKVEVDGDVAKVRGTAIKRGPTSTIHEEYDDAGNTITVDGTHRPIRTDMRLSYGDKRVDLTCDDAAFAFNLTVVTEPIE